MRAHLELHYQSEQVADEAVLSMYPSAIRRKVLRHLYLEPLRNCYLFKSCKPKFLVRVPAGEGAQGGSAGGQCRMVGVGGKAPVASTGLSQEKTLCRLSRVRVRVTPPTDSR